MLNFNIYGLRVQINFIRSEDEKEVANLLKFFLRKHIEDVDVILDFKKKERAYEIGALLFPYFADRGIWGFHAGGFHFNGGHLTVGPSDSGKSTLSYMAFKNGLPVISDDITLLRESSRGIEILPFYSTILVNEKAIVPKPELFEGTTLKYVLFPIPIAGTTFVRKTQKKVDLLRRLVPHFLWAYDKKIQAQQKRFLERLCDYSAFEVYWDKELFDDIFIFRKILDEIIQS